MSDKERDLGLLELVAIALGGMIGGGIFSVLGVAVDEVGNAAPVAIGVGALLALLAAVSYARLATHFQDEGATYSFFKLTYPDSHLAAAAIGWVVVFGYVSTLALYAFTFASYLGSLFPEYGTGWLRPTLAAGILVSLAALNIVSVKLMGRLEDLMVYSKLVMLLVITAVLYHGGSADHALPVWDTEVSAGALFNVAALTFVAFEGFQLAIHAYSEVRDPQRNVPRAIYLAVAIAGVLYVLLAEGALWALDHQQIVRDKEFALAAGAAEVIGPLGHALVMAAALLATSSAISGTLFGASRLAAVIADDGYLPAKLSRRIHGNTPALAIVVLAVLAWLLVLSDGLELIIEFGSLTFIVVSLLMAVANMKLRAQTKTHLGTALVAIIGLAAGGLAVLVRQATEHPAHLAFTVGIALLLVGAAFRYSWRQDHRSDVGP